jgi:catecholate siderophore receptor
MVPAGTYYGAANAATRTTPRPACRPSVTDHRFDDAWSVRNAFRYYDYTLDRNNTLVGSVNEKALTAPQPQQRAAPEDGYFNQTELVQTRWPACPTSCCMASKSASQTKDQLFRHPEQYRHGIAVQPGAAFGLPFNVSVKPSTNNVGIMTVSSVLHPGSGHLVPELEGPRRPALRPLPAETRERRAGQPTWSAPTCLSPRAGVVYQPTQDRSYTRPGASPSSRPARASRAANTASIAPEETTNSEIGAKFDFMPGLSHRTARLERTNIKATNSG